MIPKTATSGLPAVLARHICFGLAAALAVSGVAMAQTAPEPAPAALPDQPAAEAAPKKSVTEEITVTGSRVRRKDLNTPAPVTVLTRDQISA